MPVQNETVDLRSDTVTRPTEAMRAAMAAADVGDDGYGDDPTVNALEAKAAERLGKERAMLVSSGTMSNLVALLTHTGRGGEVLLEQSAHIIRSEMGSMASVAGLMHRPIAGRGGAMDLNVLAEAVMPGMSHRRLGTALICMENTHNAGGGSVLPLDHMAAVHAIGREHGIPVHMDGARIFNAAAHLRVPVAEAVRHCDSVTFCLSKGLSAPFGSVLCGSAAFIDRARGFRRMVGGMLRQAGVMAAAGIVALDEMVDRLGEDHAVARRLAEGLNAIDPALTDPAAVETNIVMVDLSATGRPAELWVEDLKALGVLCAVARAGVIRLVTNRHVGTAQAERALEAFASLWARHGGAALTVGAAD